MQASAARPPIGRETVAHLMAAAGLSLTADELDGLVAPVAAIYAALDGLDALDLSDLTPLPRRRLPYSASPPTREGGGPSPRPPDAGGSEVSRAAGDTGSEPRRAPDAGRSEATRGGGAERGGAADARELAFLPLVELAEQLRRGAVSPVEVTRAYLERIGALEPTLRAFITVTGEQALAEAAAAEREIGAGQYRGPLHGVPLAIKDLFYTAGVRTTAGSKILADFVPAEDAACVARLRAAGALSLGKTNLEEFAYGATSINPHYGACRNPWDPERIAGGSSGGSAAAVAAGLCSAALGTDSGGSIRQPSALCGLVGLKPTYGRVSRHGVVPLSWSQDHVGPMARTVRDAAVLLQALAGHDPRDPASSPAPVPDYLAGLEDGVRGLRVGLPRDFFFTRVDSEVADAVRGAARALEGLGAQVEEVPLPHATQIWTAGAAILYAEATAYHEAWLRSRPEDYGPLVRARLRVGAAILGADYLKAQRARALLVAEADRLFDRLDVLLTPTTPIAAPRQDESVVRWPDGTEEDVRGATLRFTRPFNLLGFPAASVPCGFTAGGLPLGLQIVARPFAEALVLRVAGAYEAAHGWGARRPAVS
jgi:aspartyl-tRNA(Asn)/glutamyl-tRNA(Gln) amidotransferase subunit A